MALLAAAKSPYKRSYGKYCAPLARFGKVRKQRGLRAPLRAASGDVGEGMVGERQASALAWGRRSARLRRSQSPSQERMRSITAGSSIKAITRICAPHSGQASGSTS